MHFVCSISCNISVIRLNVVSQETRMTAYPAPFNLLLPIKRRPHLLQPLGVAFAGFGIMFAVVAPAETPAQTISAVDPIDRSLPASTHSAPAILLAEAEGDIIDVATAHGSFRSFTSLLEQLGMSEDLRGYGRFTVFAPTDEAFRAVPQTTLDTLLADRELMAKVLSYHVVSSGTPLSARDLRSVGSLTTLERSSIELDRRRGKLYVNEAQVIEADIAASNGVIHAIDQVLIPPDVASEISSRAMVARTIIGQLHR